MAITQKINFVETDPDLIVKSLVNYYELLTGKKLQPAQIEQLQFNSVAYRIALMLNQINEAANQNLIAFATGAALEALAELVGVTRLPASPAQCLIRFNIVDGHTAFTFDEGQRVQAIDGQAVFTTIESKAVQTSDTYVDIKCECTKTGVIGNDYIPGKINIILDPRPYVSAAANLDISNGGNDDETDELLRARVRLAPSAFSVAGPKGAYKYWAKTAHPSIVDVAVTIGHDTITPFAVIPGQVDIFPLLLGNATPSTEIIDAVLAICNDDKIRPLSDTVLVKSPTKLDYSIGVALTLTVDAISSNVVTQVNKLLQNYVDARKNKLGIDVVINQLIGVCQSVDGVYSTAIISPVADVPAAENEFTACLGITVNAVGTNG